jgi:hypothetical protein
MGALRYLNQLFDPNPYHERQRIHAKYAVVDAQETRREYQTY